MSAGQPKESHASRARRIARIRRPIVAFFETEASGGILLIAATLIALIWANLIAGHSYHDLWHTKISIGVGDRALALTLHHWINDGLMAVFFFFVGLEIKREVLTGELATWRKAALPALGAVGGMAIPALVYFFVNPSGAEARGWAVPMATDIAFAVGILMLLGKRIPLGLKVFLTALAVVDDLGAVLVIAVFYTGEIAWVYLGWGIGLLGVLVVLAALGARARWVFVVFGLAVWFCFLKSGVHATVAGVLVALVVPHRPRGNREEVLNLLDDVTDDLQEEDNLPTPVDEEHPIAALETIQDLAYEAGSPLQHLEHQLAKPVAYVIMPVFALANAGVDLNPGALGSVFSQGIPLGILLGLVLGKQLGIFAFAWLAVRVGWANLPRGVSWRGIYGAALLGGIGFTMSLFIANLAFTEPALLEEAKMGILVGSLVCAVAGALVLIRLAPVPEPSAAEN